MILPLEDRRLLTNFVVTKLADDGSTHTLRWAVEQADAATTPSSIQFDVVDELPTIMLSQGPLALTNTADPTTFSLDLGETPVTIIGDGHGPVFQVDSGVQVTMDSMTITGGSASGDGGGVYNAGTLTVNQCTITGNTANVGGGIYSKGKLYLQDSTISDNSAAGSGPGLFNLGTADLTACTLSGNTTDPKPVTRTNGGLAFLVYGQSYSGSGGAVFNHGTINLTDCTLSGNSALEGAGMFNYGQAEMLACTVTGNDTSVSSSYTPEQFHGIVFDYSSPSAGGYLTMTDVLITGNNPDSTPWCSDGVDAQGVSPIPALENCGFDGPIGTLGNYGGPTETVPLLPGNPAIGAGVRIPGVTSDQRGVSLPTAPDIGAYQDQGYVLTIDPGGNPQSAVTGDTFAQQLTVTVTANVPAEPVVGGTVTFTAPSSGPSAQLSTTTATIGSSGVAQVTATANATPGTYTVTASDAGSSTVDFALTNLYPSAFTGLGGQSMSITYGTPTLTISGTISGDSEVPTGQEVAITLDGVVQQAVIASNGGFSTTFDTSSLPVSATPYTIGLAYKGDASFGPSAATIALSVTRATPSLLAQDTGGPFFGGSYPATPLIAGANGVVGSNLEGVLPSLAYYSGTYASVAQLAGVTPLTSAPVYVGAYTAVVAFPGSADYTSGSELTNFNITPAQPSLIVSDSGGAYTGGDFLASVAVAGANQIYGPILEGVGLTASYYDGTYTSLTQLAGQTPLPGPPSDAGAYTVLGQFAGSPDYAAAGRIVGFTIAAATPSLTVSDAGGPFTGSAFTAAETISGVVGTTAALLQGVTPSLTYYSGTYNNPAQLADVTPLAGPPSGPGAYTVLATFPASADYAPTSALTDFAVTKATPTVSLVDASEPYTGTAFAAGVSVTGVSGTATPSLEGVVPSATYYQGTYTSVAQLAALTPLASAPSAIGAYTVLATFAGSTDYTAGSALANFNITPAIPRITWFPSTTIPYGTPLGSGQLDATADVPGTFVYTPAAGAILPTGGGQVVTVSFKPDDTTDYADSTDSVTVEVVRATPTLNITASGSTFDGSPVPVTVTVRAVGAAPAASLENVLPTLTYYAGTGTTGANLGPTPPTSPGTYTVVATFPGSPDYTTTVSPPATFTIGRGDAALTLSASGITSVTMQPVTFVASVSGAGGTPGGTVTFLDGGTPIATVPLDGSGHATLTTTSLAPGSNAITATYSGDADFLGGASGSTSDSVGPAATQVVLVPYSVLKKKRLKEVELIAQIEPLAPGGGAPTGGTVTVEFSKKHGKKVKVTTLGVAPVSSGAATLMFKPGKVLKKPLTILFSGDSGYTASRVTPPVVTKKALKPSPAAV